jgi:Holliday junction DNA helicase RuvA
VARLQADLGDKVAPRPAAEAVSALVNLGYAQVQASAAIAAAMQEAGDGAETARLIRLGLRELSR